MTVVSDTSSISNLLQIGLLDILHVLFGELLIAPSVQRELLAYPKHGEQIAELDWIKVQTPKNQELLAQLLRELDIGESQSIVLAIESKADFLLIDEYKGRMIAESYGVKITGILGILIQARKKGLISSVKEPVSKLVEVGFRLDRGLVEKVLKSLGEL